MADTAMGSSVENATTYGSSPAMSITTNCTAMAAPVAGHAHISECGIPGRLLQTKTMAMLHGAAPELAGSGMTPPMNCDIGCTKVRVWPPSSAYVLPSSTSVLPSSAYVLCELWVTVAGVLPLHYKTNSNNLQLLQRR